MKRAIEKAKALVAAMEYIRLFRGKIVVVKLGGSVLDDLPKLEGAGNSVALGVERDRAAGAVIFFAQLQHLRFNGSAVHLAGFIRGGGE